MKAKSNNPNSSNKTERISVVISKSMNMLFVVWVLLFLVSPVHVPNAQADGYLEKKAKEKAKRLEKEAKKVGDKVEKEVKERVGDVEKGATKLLGKKNTKNITKALKDTFNAVESAGRLAGRTAELPGKTLERSMHKKDPLDSINFIVTNPIKQSNKDSFRAVQDSEVLAVAGQLAASFYGGPSGAAAYAAWMTYNATGGDMDAALKQGAIVGITAYVSQSIADMPDGSSKVAAKAAFENAMKIASGEKPNDIKEQLLSSFVSELDKHISAQDLNFIERTATAAAIGGATVAASGGNKEAVEQGFLRSGAKVGIQELNDELSNSEKKAKEKVFAAIPPEQLKHYAKLLDESKAAIAESKLAQAITKAKNNVEKDVRDNPTLVQVKKAKEEYDAKTQLAQRQWEEVQQKLLAKPAEIPRTLKDHLNAVQKMEKELDTQFLAARNNYQIGVAEAEKTIQAKAVAVFTEKVKSQGLNAVVLANGTVLSWDSKKLLSHSTNAAVFVTYSEQLSELADTIISNPELASPQ